jgi:hypothetical protein
MFEIDGCQDAYLCLFYKVGSLAVKLRFMVRAVRDR